MTFSIQVFILSIFLFTNPMVFAEDGNHTVAEGEKQAPVEKPAIRPSSVPQSDLSQARRLLRDASYKVSAGKTMLWKTEKNLSLFRGTQRGLMDLVLEKARIKGEMERIENVLYRLYEFIAKFDPDWVENSRLDRAIKKTKEALLKTQTKESSINYMNAVEAFNKFAMKPRKKPAIEANLEIPIDRLKKITTEMITILEGGPIEVPGKELPRIAKGLDIAALEIKMIIDSEMRRQIREISKKHKPKSVPTNLERIINFPN